MQISDMLTSDEVLERAAELRSQGTPFVLATVVRCESPTSAKPGAKAIVDASGGISGWVGGGCAQPAVVATAKKALDDGQPRLIRVSPTKGAEVEPGIVDFGMTCHSGGTLDIFLEPYVDRARLLIIGASPAARALCGLASQAGFEVTAAFPGIDAETFPQARRVIDGLDLESADLATPQFVVVATQGKRDEPGLEAALALDVQYIAFIASTRKAEKLRTYLKERGHAAERVDAIVSPAGVEIGAVTPEEIAVSVLAGLVKARREEGVTRHQVAAAASAGGPVPADLGAVASAVDPVCGMDVDIATAEFQSEYHGSRFYFCCAGCQHSFEKSPEQYLETAGAGR